MSARPVANVEDKHQTHGVSVPWVAGCQLCHATRLGHAQIDELRFERVAVGYVGVRHVQDDAHVYVWRHETQALERLPMRFDLVNHSPDGFEWGYHGSGPAQLAMALVAHALDDATARWLYQPYKDAVVARLPHESWSLTRTSIEEQCAQLARRLT